MFPWFFGPDDAVAAAVMLLVCFLIALPLALLYHGCREDSDTAQAAMAAGSQPAVVRMCPDCAHRLTCQECGRPLPSQTKDQRK